MMEDMLLDQNMLLLRFDEDENIVQTIIINYLFYLFRKKQTLCLSPFVC